MTNKEALAQLLAELEAIAVIFDQYDQQPHYAAALSGGRIVADVLFEYVSSVATCRLKLLMPADAEGVRARADRLKRAFARRRRPQALSVSTRQRPYSAKTAAQFEADGELDNLRAYNELYGR